MKRLKINFKETLSFPQVSVKKISTTLAIGLTNLFLFGSSVVADPMPSNHMVYSGSFKDQNGSTHMIIGEYEFTGPGSVIVKSIDINANTTGSLAEPTGQRWLYNPSYIEGGPIENLEHTNLKNNLISKYGTDYAKWRNPAGKAYQNQLVDYKYLSSNGSYPVNVNPANGLVNWNNARYQACAPGEIYRPTTGSLTTKSGSYIFFDDFLSVTVGGQKIVWKYNYNNAFRLISITDLSSGQQMTDLRSAAYISSKTGYLHYTKLASHYNAFGSQDASVGSNDFSLGEPLHSTPLALPFRWDDNPTYGLLNYTVGANNQTPGNYSGLYEGYNNLSVHSAFVAHTMLVNQHSEWPALMSYYNSHIYDSGTNGHNYAAINDAYYGPYCYDAGEINNGHRKLMLPVYDASGMIDKIVYIEVSSSTVENGRYPVVGYGYMVAQ
ncbi:hypothetical protein [Aliikangiella coralliicola]|uniref:Uncharacterized protein n=1 Tax=Aliikangiella coralliicola TaxID=2592383 RepID=A0A545UCF3_9GAMM|nr:hypothetical protein [Aliikangiella coralliicola]TQV87152.1 hypothetical protein FLL46_15215 [Aliikangiella coralliicola]